MVWRADSGNSCVDLRVEVCGRVIGSVFFSLQFRFCFTVEFPSEGTDLADSSGGSHIEFRSGKGAGLRSKSAFFLFSGLGCTWCGGRILETNA